MKLEAYVVEATSKCPVDFWRSFDELSDNLASEAFADDADDELLERYTRLLANADEAGFAVPPEVLNGTSP